MTALSSFLSRNLCRIDRKEIFIFFERGHFIDTINFDIDL